MKKLGGWMAASLVCALVGCDEGGEDGPDGGQLPGDGDGEVVEVGVTVATGSPAALLAVRNSDEPAWRQVEVNGEREVEVMVHGAYEVVMVCAGATAADPVTVTRFARTVDDGERLEQHCGGSEASVHGTLRQPGQVALANSAMAMNRSDWGFALPVRTGTFDLMLLRGAPGALEALGFRRGVQVSGDLDLGAIDLTAETLTPLVEVHPKAENLLAGERGMVRTWINTGSTGASISTGPLTPGAGLSTRVAPAAALTAADRQSVAITVSAPEAGKPAQVRSRSAAVAVKAGEDPVVLLPEPMGPAAFAVSDLQASATWTDLPDGARVTFTRGASAPAANRRHVVVMSPSFLEETKATSAHLDFTSVPGFKAEWQLDAKAAQTLSLTASQGEGFFEIGASSTTVSQQLPAQP